MNNDMLKKLVSPLHLKRENHFQLHVLARKMELYVQEESFSQEMTCFQAHNGRGHKVLLFEVQQLNDYNLPPHKQISSK